MPPSRDRSLLLHLATAALLESISPVFIHLAWIISKVTKVQGLRPMTREDIPGIHSLLQTNFCKFHLSPILSVQDVEHLLLPRENVIDTYVVEVWPHCISTLNYIEEEKKVFSLGFFFGGNLKWYYAVVIKNVFASSPPTQGDNGALTDIVSFYSFSSRVLNHPVHTSLRGARLLYVVSTRTKLVDLMEDTLVLAKSVSVSL